MTDQHLINAPSNELIDAWANKYEGHMPEWVLRHVAAEAAQWGADQELEACCAELPYYLDIKVRAARRPELHILKEKALEVLNGTYTDAGKLTLDITDLNTILRALEALPNE